MRILILNPNTTDAVTTLMVETGRAVAAPDTKLVAMTAPRGFPYISNRAEAQIGGAIVLELLVEAYPGVDGAIVAAFGDPGLFGARELFDIPVVGVSEAAMLTACMLGQRFVIVTFAAALCGWYRDCVAMHGLSDRCAGVVAPDEDFSSIAELQQDNLESLVALANRAILETKADVMIFAGAPLSGLCAQGARPHPGAGYRPDRRRGEANGGADRAETAQSHDRLLPATRRQDIAGISRSARGLYGPSR